MPNILSIASSVCYSVLLVLVLALLFSGCFVVAKFELWNVEYYPTAAVRYRISGRTEY